jgi:hypothetical protein
MLKLKHLLSKQKVWLLTPVVAVVLVCLAFALTSVNHKQHNAAGINEQVNFQGRLLTSTGAVVPDGTYNIRFKIYQDGDGVLGGGDESLKWTETRESGNKVTVKNGYFSVYLGSVTALTGIDWNQSVLWLSIDIGGTGSPSYDGEMSPFTRFGSTPYALNSKQLGGIASTGFVQLGPSAVQADSGTNNSIFINKTGSSGNILQLQKNGVDVLSVSNAGMLTTTYTSSSGTAGLEGGILVNYTDTGAVSTGTDDSRGIYITSTRTGGTGSGVINNYGVYSLASGDTGGTSTGIGVAGVAAGADLNIGVGGAGLANGSGTVAELTGTNGQVLSLAFTGTATAANALQGLVDISTAGTYTTASGLLIKTATASGSGVIATNYGAWIQTQTAGTSDYGLRVDTADTQTLWIGGNTDGTTAAAGIKFGQTSGTSVNLYRQANDVLMTDDTFVAGTRLAVNSTGSPGTNELFRVNTPNAVDNSTIAIITNTGTNTNKILTLQGVSGQFAAYLSNQNSSGGTLSSIDLLGSFRAPSGSTTAPGLSFQAENTLGLYRVSSGVIGITANGDIAQFSSTGQQLTGDFTFSTGATRTLSVATSTTGAGNTFAITGAGGLNGGVNLGGALTLTGGTGGNSTGIGAGGAGGALNLNGGATGASNWQGSVGGAVNIAGGSPAASVSAVTAIGGAVNINGGTGGSSTGLASAGGGAGGAIAIASGSGGAAAGGGNQTGGAGANITLTSGSGGTSIGSAANANGGSITIQGGSAGTGGGGAAGTAGNINLQVATGATINVGANGIANTIQIGNTTGAVTQTINVGNNATASSITALVLGSAISTSSTTINAGTGNLTIGNNGLANTIQIGNTTGAVQQTINIGTNATASSATPVNIGSTIGSSKLTLNAGTFGVDIANNGVSNTLQIGNANNAVNQSINIGNNSNASGSTTVIVGCSAGACPTTVQAGSSGLFIGNAGVSNTIQIGNTTGAVSQTTNIGTNSTASSTNNITIGSTTAGTTAIQGTTTVTGRSSGTANTLSVTNGSSGQIGLLVKGASSQSASLQEWQDSGAFTWASIGSGTNGGQLRLYGKSAANATGNAEITFSSNGGTSTGLFTLDYAGNMVFRNSTAGGMYFDGNTGGINFRNSSFATVASLSNTGAALFQNSANSAAGFQVKDSGTEVLFTADTASRSGSGGNLIKIGNSTGTDTATTILQLDGATSAPTSNLAALNGGMYYDSTGNKVKIIENGVIKTLCNTTDAGCGAGGASTLQSDYNATSGNTITATDARDLLFTFADTTTDPNFVINLQCVTSCSTNGRFAVQSAGTDAFTIAPTGYITATKHMALGATAATSTTTVLALKETTTLTAGGWKGQETEIHVNAASASSLIAMGTDSTVTLEGTSINYTGSYYGNSGGVNVDTTGTVTTGLGLQGYVNNRGAGTVTNAAGVIGLILNTGGGSIGTSAGLTGQIGIGSSGTISTGSGLSIASASSTGGTITANYGIKVDAQTAGASDYGARIDTADTQTLWLGGTAAGDGGTANTGIAFGSARDTNLYRSAAATLRTDGKLDIETPTSTSTTAGTEIAQTINFNDTGVVTTGTDETDGLKVVVSRSGATGGTINTYGVNVSAAGSTSGAAVTTATGVSGIAYGADSNYGVSATGIVLAGTAVTETIGLNAGVNTFGAAGSTTTAYALQGGVGIDGGAGTYSTAAGLNIKTATNASAGTITANYGIKVDTQTVGTSSYGLRVDTAGTQTVWIGGNADSTTAAAGIAFGQTVGTQANLYRGANNQLKTDSQLMVKPTTNSTTALTVQNSTGMVLANVDTASVNTSNLVTNPSFETNTTGWTARTGCTLTQVASTAFNGTGSGKCVNTATANAGVNYPVSLSSTTTYNVIVYVKADAAGANFSTLEIGRADDGSTDTNCVTAQTAVNTGWTRFTCSFTTGTVSGSPYIYVKQTDATIRTFYVDAVVLQTQANADTLAYRDGKIQLNGVVTSPTIFQNSENSSTAFTINNAAGGQVFAVDTTDANIVTNPSFEVGTTGWAAKGAATITRDTSQQQYGLASLKVVSTAAANVGAQYTLPYSVPVGQQITYSVSVKLGATAFTANDLVTGYVNGSGDNNCTMAPAVSATIPTTTGWTRFTCTATVASTVATAIYFKQVAATAHTYYIDAVQVENGATATAYGLGRLSLSGEIITPLALRNQGDTTNAFQILNSANTTTLFNVDSLNQNITTNSTATTLTAFNINANSITTGAALAISATNASLSGNALSVTTTSTGVPSTGLVYFNFNGIRTSAGVAFQVTDISTTSATTMRITSNSLTTGNALAISATATGLTGNALSVTTGSTGVPSTGLVYFNFNGARTAAGVAFQVTDVSTTLATTMQITSNSLTSGKALSISATATTLTGNALLVTTSSTSSVTNGLVYFNFSGIRTTAGNGFQIDDASTTVATTMKINANSLTTGNGLAISATATGLTGNALSVTTGSTGVPTNGLVYYNFNGARTAAGVAFQVTDVSTTLATTMQITSNALTTGTAMQINVNALTTGTGLKIANTTSHASADNSLVIQGGNNAGAETGTHIQFLRPDGTVIGTIAQNAATTVAYNTTSDERVKQNITDTHFGLDTVLSLQVRDYDYKADPSHTQLTGFVAQELYKLFPGAVTVGGDEVDANGNLTRPWSVDYGKLTPLLAKGIQDLNTKVEALDAKVNAMQPGASGSTNGGLKVMGPADFMAESNFYKLATFIDKVIFREDVQFNKDVAVKGDTTLDGQVIAGKNTAGIAKIAPGQTTVTVQFTKPYAANPVITLTPLGLNAPKYGLTNITPTSFDIQIDATQAGEVNFNWLAVGTQ